MPHCTALLRGVNVGGRTMIAMPQLRVLFESLGFTDVSSILQSGNIIFECGDRAPGTTGSRFALDSAPPVKLLTAIERQLEKATERRFGKQIDFLIRSAVEFQMIVARNPFPTEADHDPSRLLVMFMKRPVSASLVQTLRESIRGRELVQSGGRHLYMVYPDGVGRSKLTHTLVERTLGIRGTGRNWNTVLKLAARLGPN